MQKKYRTYILSSFLVIGVVSIFFLNIQLPLQKDTYQTYFAILPHFEIQTATIDKAYKTILDRYNLS